MDWHCFQKELYAQRSQKLHDKTSFPAGESIWDQNTRTGVVLNQHTEWSSETDGADFCDNIKQAKRSLWGRAKRIKIKNNLYDSTGQPECSVNSEKLSWKMGGFTNSNDNKQLSGEFISL